MKIEPTIRPEIKRENERQKKFMMENHNRLRKIANDGHAMNFGKMIKEKINDEDKK